MDGIIVIDKPKGLSSQQVVSKLKKILQVKKAGHTGTLDPLATGVLPVAIGEATKIISFLDESLKIYEVEGVLGVTTDTYDADGKVEQETDPGPIDRTRFQQALNSFLGAQIQVPPLYSAIKVKGKAAYAYARQGQQVDRPSRKVEIRRLEILAFKNPGFRLRVECSRGTYVRSLVHDLGEKLGCGSHVRELRRLQTGPFDLHRAVSLLQLAADPRAAMAGLWSIEDCLRDLPMVGLESREEWLRVKRGAPLKRLAELLNNKGLLNSPVTLAFADQIVAIVKTQAQGLDYQRVLHRD